MGYGVATWVITACFRRAPNITKAPSAAADIVINWWHNTACSYLALKAFAFYLPADTWPEFLGSLAREFAIVSDPNEFSRDNFLRRYGFTTRENRNWNVRHLVLLYTTKNIARTVNHLMQPKSDLTQTERQNELAVTVHHVLTCWCFYMTFFYESGSYLSGFSLLCEITNFFVDNVKAYKVFNLSKEKGTWGFLYRVNGVMLWLSYVVFRVALFSFFTLRWWRDMLYFGPELRPDDDATFYKSFYFMESVGVAIAGHAVTILSFLWFGKITRGLIDTVWPSKSAKRRKRGDGKKGSAAADTSHFVRRSKRVRTPARKAFADEQATAAILARAARTERRARKAARGEAPEPTPRRTAGKKRRASKPKASKPKAAKPKTPKPTPRRSAGRKRRAPASSAKKRSQSRRRSSRRSKKLKKE